MMTWSDPDSRFVSVDGLRVHCRRTGHGFRRIYGLTADTLVLVRPDGYLAHVATQDMLDTLTPTARRLDPARATGEASK